jgi:glycosyltransferase involved in cell wall biosynthesis
VPYLLEPRGAYDPNIVTRRRVIKALWWSAAEKRMVQRSLAVHAFFSSERDHLQRLGYSGPVIVAPNGVRCPNGRSWDGGSGGYLLWMGRFDPEHKGLDLLLDAVSLVERGERPLLRLHGPDWRGRKSDVVEMVKARRLDAWVTIGDPIYGEEKVELLSRARAFVYPSRWEAFGNSPAEAAAMGVPVLATSYPLGVYLAERSAGIAVEPTPYALATGIRDVLAPAAAEMGMRAREVVSKDFSWETVARSWLSQLQVLV